MKDTPVSWVSYIGLVERGVPSSLRLIQLPVRSTVLRAPGPGPITKQLWLPIARKVFPTGYRVCLHTDSARAYNVPLADVSHTSVVHQVKKVDGVWVRPIFARQTTIDIGGGRVAKVKSGTQTIDGFWSHLRDHISGNPARASDSVDGMIRMAQFLYWAGGAEPISKLPGTFR
eukprot:1230502-Amphidinium_carterae.1